MDTLSRSRKLSIFNTRDALPTCKPGDPGEKVTCWPAPENPETINRKQLGDLKLSDAQEDLLVAFLKTLTDGYSPPANWGLLTLSDNPSSSRQFPSIAVP